MDKLFFPHRIREFNSIPIKKEGYVVYWMQQSQRAEDNHALEYAIYLANQHKLSLVVLFVISDNFPLATKRHYRFMLQGLRVTRECLKKRGIKLVVRQGCVPEEVADFCSHQAGLVVDRGYLRIQREWREEIARLLNIKIVQVESDVIVPVETASPKEEYTAGTFRPKISVWLEEFLRPIENISLKIVSANLKIPSINIDNIDLVLKGLKLPSIGPCFKGLLGGSDQAENRLRDFINNKLNGFNQYRNDPTREFTSGLSPYLHFGQISPIKIALDSMAAQSPGSSAFLEELIVRRELSMNFTFYNKKYDEFECLPDWAQKTLHEHAFDPRPVLYSAEDLENARTDDPYWNAAQKELIITGKIHGYMRMYWGKRFLEWSPSPEEAYYRALRLNNLYALDGRDPNGFAGVAWCFGKHDRAWGQRAIFGKARYMNANGLKRKFKIDSYVEKIEALARN